MLLQISLTTQKLFKGLQNESSDKKYKVDVIQLVHYVIRASEHGLYDGDIREAALRVRIIWNGRPDDDCRVQKELHRLLYLLSTTGSDSDIHSTHDIVVHDFVVFKAIDPRLIMCRVSYVTQTLARLRFLIRGVILLEAVNEYEEYVFLFAPYNLISKSH